MIAETIKTVGIIAEYNPFHNGHLYQINQIKKIIPDSVIIAVMSGNIVQRGDFALLSKYERAKTAVLNGVDVVFELPPVYSCAPANIFASAAVYIMHSLQGTDYICFGSECGNIELLDFAAEKTGEDNDIFNIKLREYIRTNKNIGYSQSVSRTFIELYGNEMIDARDIFNGSNNILAIEYLKALRKLNSHIKPVTIKRIGGNYRDNIVSASYIREFLTNKDNSENQDSSEKLKKYIPEKSYDMFIELINSGKFADISNISSAIISRINRLDVKELAKFADIVGGMEYRIKKAAENSFDYNSLIHNLSVKHITPSSSRRMIINIFFGITREMQKQPPEYVNLLAANQAGRNFLNSIRKKSEIQIITKPSAYTNYINNVNFFIDRVYKLALFNPDGEINPLKHRPYII